MEPTFDYDDLKRKREILSDLVQEHNDLIEDEDEHLDWYHILDVMDTEDEAIEVLKEEIEKLKSK